MADTKRVLVVGATGQVGAAVMRLAAHRPELDAIGATRRAAVPAGWRHLDLDMPETLLAALDGIDSAILVTGYTVDMLRQSKAFVDAARYARLGHLVHVGACGGDSTDVAHYGWHQFVERYIEWSGIGFTHLRPEIFMQNLLGYGDLPAVRGDKLVNWVGDARQSWVDANDVAQAAVAALVEPERHGGRTYRLGYEAATFAEIAAIMTEELGRPIRYEPRSPDEFYAEVFARGGEPAYMTCIRDCFRRLTAGELTETDEVFDTFRAFSDRPPRNLRSFIRANSNSLLGQQ